jgi:xylose isomerase
MDTIARSLIIADKLAKHGELDKLKAARYASFNTGKGADFEAGKLKYNMSINSLIDSADCVINEFIDNKHRIKFTYDYEKNYTFAIYIS